MDEGMSVEGLGNYYRSLQQYTNNLSNEKLEEDEADKKADTYNAIESSITEPIGGLFLHHPVNTLLEKTGAKKAVKKALGAARKKITDAARKAVSGDLDGAKAELNPDGTELREGLEKVANKGKNVVSDIGEQARNGLSKLTGRTLKAPAPSEEIELTTFKEPTQGDLSTQSIVPKAEAQAGDEGEELFQGLSKAKAGPLFPEVSEPTVVDPFAYNPDPAAQKLGFTEDDIGDLAKMSPEDMISHINARAMVRGVKTVDHAIADASRASGRTGSEMAGTQEGGDSTIARALGTKPESAPLTEGGAAPQAPPEPQPPADVGPGAAAPKPPAAPDPAAAGTSADGADSGASAALKAAAKGGEKDANSIKSALASGTEEGGEESALLAANEGLDDAAAAEGGANPFADVAAAVLGIGTLLFGALDHKTATTPHYAEFIPSAQFGI